jgi:hypothetical protein
MIGVVSGGSCLAIELYTTRYGVGGSVCVIVCFSSRYRFQVHVSF